MSDQSPTANGRDQRGPDVTNTAEQPPLQDESGFTSGATAHGDAVPSEPDIEKGEDPSKD